MTLKYPQQGASDSLFFNQKYIIQCKHSQPLLNNTCQLVQNVFLWHKFHQTIHFPTKTVILQWCYLKCKIGYGTPYYSLKDSNFLLIGLHFVYPGYQWQFSGAWQSLFSPIYAHWPLASYSGLWLLNHENCDTKTFGTPSTLKHKAKSLHWAVLKCWLTN